MKEIPQFEIITFKGAIPLVFNSTPEQVHKVLGVTPSDSNSKIGKYSNCLEEYYLESSQMKLDIVCMYEKDPIVLESIGFGYTTHNLYFKVFRKKLYRLNTKLL